MKTTQEIVESIDSRLRELNDEIKSLDAARVALDRRERPPSRRAPAKVTRRRIPAFRATSRTNASAQSRRESSAEVSRKPAPRSGTRARTISRSSTSRVPKVVPADRMVSLLSDNGGLTTSALAEKTGVNRDHVLRLLRDLETAGRIRRTGQRRATDWHAISDEDRIRQRAAELAGRRKGVV